MTAGTDSEPLVWYAAYGSNLWAHRFLTYLTGGPVAHSPTGRVQTGARDPSPPRSHQPVLLPQRLFFARSSRSWAGGGVAFIDPAGPAPEPEADHSGSGAGPDDGDRYGRQDTDRPGSGAGTLARLWLITAGQFVDVAGQENGRLIDEGALDPATLAPGDQRVVSDGWYGRVLHLGPGPEGWPVLTFTCPDPDDPALAPRPAHPAYLRVIGLGLMETWALDPPTAARYLCRRSPRPADAPGAGDPEAELARDLARWAAGGDPRRPPSGAP